MIFHIFLGFVVTYNISIITLCFEIHFYFMKYIKNSKLWRNILDDIIQVDNLSHFSEKRSHSKSLLAAIRMNGMIAKLHVHHRGANLMDKI